MFLHEYVTGGGLAGEALPPSWAAEGGAMRRALAEDFAWSFDGRMTMTLDARLPDERDNWHLSDSPTIVRVGPGEELATFTRLAAESDYTLCIAPETGGLLEARARIIESVGGRSLGSSPEAIALCGDKLRLGEHLRAIGIDTPITIRVNPRDGLPRDFPYPAVLKPIDGAGSIDTYYVESPSDVPESALLMKDAILQPFVPGTPMSASFLVDSDGRAASIGAGRQLVTLRSGRFVYEGGIVPFPIAGGGSRLLDAVESVPGLLGWIGVDFAWDESRGITVLEINPRVTTSYVGWRELAPSRTAIAGVWLGSIHGPRLGDERSRLAAGPPISGSARFSADGRVDRVESA
ncbi:MAG: hypothetical protein JWN86_195 [Planctomycetota bacterium]|nr:hypothetical protein [Planctomycetota bacterium]